jgi:hypothetical protein
VVGDCGILFPAGDHHQLAASIGRLLADSALAGELSARGTRRAHQFSIDATAAQYESIFETIIAGTSVPAAQSRAAAD